ncbi:hypothetical protein EIN_030080, partial [Entamoeba invadens IP1]
QMLSTKIKATLPLLRKIVLGRDAGQTEADTQLFPSQFYLLSLFGFISDQLLVRTIDAKHKPLTFFNMTEHDANNIVNLVYLIYHFGHQKVTGSSLIELKKNKEPQNEVQDYFGELSCPLIYSSYIFAAQVAMTSPVNTLFMTSLNTNCIIRADLDKYKDNTQLFNSELLMVQLDYFTLLLTFNRFGYRESSVDQFYKYFQTNISLSSIVANVSQEPQEFLRKHFLIKEATKNAPNLLYRGAQHRQVGVPSIYSSYATASFVFNQQSHTSQTSTSKLSKEIKKKRSIFGFTSSSTLSLSTLMESFKRTPKAIMSMDQFDGVIDSIGHRQVYSDRPLIDAHEDKNTKDYVIDYTQDVEVLQYRKHREELAKTMSSAEEKAFAKQTVQCRIEQLSIQPSAELSDSEYKEYKDFFLQKLSNVANEYDFFFPFVNDSFHAVFKNKVFKTCIIDAVVTGNYKNFFSFFAPPQQRENELPDLKTKKALLLQDKSFTEKFLKPRLINSSNYSVFARYLWAQFRYSNQKEKPIEQKKAETKMLAVCFGHFFAETVLFIGGDSATDLATILHLALQSMIPVTCKKTKREVKPIYYFVKAVINNIRDVLGGGSQTVLNEVVGKFTLKSTDVTPFGQMVKEAIESRQK